MTAEKIDRYKFLNMIIQVEELEERIAVLERRGEAGPEIRSLQVSLAEARTELTRLSNGCGKP